MALYKSVYYYYYYYYYFAHLLHRLRELSSRCSTTETYESVGRRQLRFRRQLSSCANVVGDQSGGGGGGGGCRPDGRTERSPSRNSIASLGRRRSSAAASIRLSQAAADEHRHRRPPRVNNVSAFHAGLASGSARARPH